MQKQKNRIIFSYLFLGALFFLVFIISLARGSVSIPLSDLWARLAGRGADAKILWQIRLPRILAAAVLGGALSVSGCLLQNFFANPIAGPFVLGISSGAKLVVALFMILALRQERILSSFSLIFAAFLGALLSMGFILLISAAARRMSALIICGIMIGYVCSAITDFVITFADDANIVNLHNWSQGSFSGSSWKDLQAMLPVLLAAMAITLFLVKPMRAYQLGEIYAGSMGLSLGRFRFLLIISSSLLSACVTAFAGPVSFVGVAVPHMVRKLFGTSRPGLVITGSFLAGSVFCMFCDLLARSLFAPTELSISSVTAVFGAPVVIGLMLGRQKRA